MAVVILGDTGRFREHELVRAAVEDRSVETHVVEIERWPGDGPIEYTVDGDACVVDEEIPFDEVTGVFSMLQSVFQVYNRDYEWFAEKPERVAYHQLREWQRLVHSLIAVFEERGARAAVSPRDRYWGFHRPAMLDLYDRNGIPIPETTFTNDPDRVEAFMNEHPMAIVHGVNGGTPERLSADDLEPDRLEKLAGAPIKLQEFVEGADTRGYVVDGEFAGMVRYDYDSPAVSFKRPEVSDEAIESVPYEPAPDLRETVVRAGELSPADYAAVDVRVAADGEFTVLESNTPGRFAAHDNAGSTAVSEHLASYLLGS